MNTYTIIELAKGALEIILMISAPVLIVGLVVGVVVSIVQAVTSIQDTTLAYVPKLAAMFLTLFLLMGWILNILVSYTRNLFGDFSIYVR